jgi:hypothetical protein
MNNQKQNPYDRLEMKTDRFIPPNGRNVFKKVFSAFPYGMEKENQDPYRHK